MRSDLPVGTVTFLFSDIEGSTRLLEHLGAGYPAVLEMHAELMRSAVAGSGGIEVSTEGDSFFCVFGRPSDALAAAVNAQMQLGGHSWPEGKQVRVRIGVHTGEGTRGGDSYVGLDVHRAARIADAGHGGQLLISDATRALVEESLPAGASLRSLGEFTLKGLSRPERIYQVDIPGLTVEFPPLRTAGGVRSVLPVPITSFVGRREVNEILETLGTTRLLTLTGPGGTGKTRLSLQVALAVRDDFPDGVFFVDLSPVTDPTLVASTIATTLALDPTGASVQDRLHRYLSDRHSLLVLDNFEQVLDAATLVTGLLEGAPGLTILVTSRSPLHVSGEREYPVPPLRLPESDAMSPAALAEFEAVRLFVERATATKPDFDLTPENAPSVAEIVIRLDGLPLALELAAARVKLLPPQALATRLRGGLALVGEGGRDLPARQRTLRAAIAWSYDLLSPPSRELFERLGVFMGGATLDEIGSVCSPELEIDLLQDLAILVDQSLLRQEDAHGEPRFRMLETIREYATERLEANGLLADAKQRHAEAYLALAEQAQPHLLGWEQKRWLDRLEADHDNLRAGLAWTLESGEFGLASRFLYALWRFWQIRGHLDEAAQRADEVLALPGGTDHDTARALEAAGGIGWWRGDRRTLEFYRQSLDLLLGTDDPAAIANAQYNHALALGWGYTGSYDEAMVELALARDTARRIGDRPLEAWSLWGEGSLAAGSGSEEHIRAKMDSFETALAIFKELNDPFGIGWALYQSAFAHLVDGDCDIARQRQLDALRLFNGFGDLSALALVLYGVATVELNSDGWERGVRLTGAARKLRLGTGAAIGELDEVQSDMLTSLKNPSDAREALGEDRFNQLLAEGAAWSVEEAVAYALDDDAG